MPGKNWVDFAALAERVSLVEAAHLLDLPLKRKGTEYRCSCPVHGGDDRTLVITVGGGADGGDVFNCIKAGKGGGDCTALVHHIQQSDNMLTAAKWLEAKLGNPGTAPEKTRQKPDTNGPPKTEGTAPDQAFKPEDYKQRLSYDHADVQAAAPWLTPEIAEQLAIGVAPTGLHRKRIAFPIRDHTGREICWISGENLKFPPRISL